MKTLRLLLSALACTTASLASAAPLDVTSDTLIKQTDMFRDAHDLPWAPATGRLGNLRQVRIVADNCTVRMVSGPENRFYLGRGAFRVVEETYGVAPKDETRSQARDVVISPGPEGSATARVGSASGDVCFTLQWATAHEMIVGGRRLALQFGRVELPAWRLSLNPSDDPASVVP